MPTPTPADVAIRRRLRLREEAGEPQHTGSLVINEVGGTVRPAGTRKYRARLIEGDRWGASGYYPSTVLKEDGPAAWPMGTLCFIDHPTPTEEAERPVRSVKDIGGRIASTPIYEGDGLYADVEVFPHAAPLIEAMASSIGMSVRADGSANWGKQQGRDGWIIESIDHGKSVDFVTRAGAGGKLVSLLESARELQEDGNVGNWLESRLHLALTQLADDMYGDGRLTRDERIVLSNAIGDALSAWTTTVEAKAPQLFQRGVYDDPGDDTTSDAGPTTMSASEAAAAKPYGDVTYADTGHQADKKARYPVDTADHVRSAWSYINQAGNAAKYSAADLATVKARIRSAAKKFGVEITETAAPSAAASLPLTESASTDGSQPDVLTHQKGSVMTTDASGSAPGTGGPADTGGQPTPITEAALADANARATLAETQRNEAIARAAALTESAQAQARTIAERDSAIAQVRQLNANETARTAVAAAIAEAANLPEALRPHIAPRITDRIIGRVPLNEAGEVSTEALASLIRNEIDREATYAAQLLEAQGVGQVRGLGSAASVTDLSEADFESQSAAMFRGIGLSEAEAVLAAKGR